MRVAEVPLCGQVLLLNREGAGPERLNGRQATALIWSGCLRTISRRILSPGEEDSDGQCRPSLSTQSPVLKFE